MNSDRLTTFAGLIAAVAHAAACNGVLPQITNPMAGIATAVWAFYTNHPLPPDVDRRRRSVDPSGGVQ